MQEEQKERIIQMRFNGLGYKRIAAELEMSLSTVKSFCKRHSIRTGYDLNDNKLLYKYCLECGAELVQLPKHRKKKFCCDECRRKWWSVHTKLINKQAYYALICQYCGKEFQSYGSKKRKYCSKECYHTARSEQRQAIRKELDSQTAAGREKLPSMPEHCLCASCSWFCNGVRGCQNNSKPSEAISTDNRQLDEFEIGGEG